MFTGLVSKIGTVEKIYKLSNGFEIVLKLEENFKDAKIGQSICVNGVCLTIETQNVLTKTLSFFCSFHTFEITNLKFLKTGAKVNLEQAMLCSSRFDGHIVTGHVEMMSKIVSIRNNASGTVFEFEMDKSLSRFIVNQGSVTINGISLTISNKKTNSFEVVIIRHTLNNTNLEFATVGSFVNIETDILAKYVENILYLDNNKKEFDKNILEKYGF